MCVVCCDVWCDICIIYTVGEQCDVCSVLSDKWEFLNCSLSAPVDGHWLTFIYICI